MLALEESDANAFFAAAVAAGATVRHPSVTRSGATSTASSTIRSATAGTWRSTCANVPHDEVVAAAADLYRRG